MTVDDYVGNEIPVSFGKRAKLRPLKLAHYMREGSTLETLGADLENCTKITWKTLFLNSLLGDKVNYCTAEHVSKMEL